MLKLSRFVHSNAIIARQKSGLQLRFFGTPPTTDSPKPEDGENSYLNKDWFRTPKESDGPRCIDPSYPNPTFQSYQTKNPYVKYDDQQLRRNFNEPLHENYEILTVQNFDVETTYSLRYMLTGVAIGAASFIGLIQIANYFDEPNGWRRNVVERDYPYIHKYQMGYENKGKKST